MLIGATVVVKWFKCLLTISCLGPHRIWWHCIIDFCARSIIGFEQPLIFPPNAMLMKMKKKGRMSYYCVSANYKLGVYCKYSCEKQGKGGYLCKKSIYGQNDWQYHYLNEAHLVVSAEHGGKGSSDMVLITFLLYPILFNWHKICLNQSW